MLRVCRTSLVLHHIDDNNALPIAVIRMSSYCGHISFDEKILRFSDDPAYIANWYAMGERQLIIMYI